MPSLQVYNSLKRSKETFVPIDEKNVQVYVCGPTVYNYAHIGNARPAVVFDVLVRLLRQLFPKVNHVSNITDIEDKIIDAARKEGVPIQQITQKYADIYNQDMAVLGVNKPDAQPLATEHINGMVEMISELVGKDFAYAKDGHVLFHVPSYEDYGRLSGCNRDDQIAGARVEVAPYKRDASDFVLWKPSKGDQPGWNSPWGYGRPGWHIECSAMSKALCGDVFDLHGGGVDLTFPHHENEIAQSCCANETDNMARYWMHNGFVTVEGEKMSKSIGNVLLVHDLIETASGEALRMNLLSAHYRQPLDWTQNGLDSFTKTLQRFYTMLSDIDGYAALSVDPNLIDEEFMRVICDDLNTPRAISVLHGLFKELQDAGDADRLKMAQRIKSSASVLGLLQNDPAAWLHAEQERSKSSQNIDEAEIDALIVARNAARAAKDFAKSDEIRDLLLSKGVTLKDGPDGTTWSV
jgi:cysteinyl-tRNA synthetase